MKNLSKKFADTLIKNPNFKIFSYKKNDHWKSLSRVELNNMVNNCVYTLKDKKISKGDRIIYKGKNSQEWIAWNIATHSIGCIWVPLYQEQNSDYCQHVINDCQSKIFITDDNIKLQNTDIISNKIENIDYHDKNYDIVHHDISTLIYTSGTTGNPKGVMLSHNNIISNLEGIRNRFQDIEENKISLNILPWAHIYSMTCELYYNLFFNNQTAICSNKDYFLKECQEIQPQILYIVPKVLEKIKQKVNFLDKPLINLLIPIILNKLFGNNLINIFMGGAKLDDRTKLFFDNNGIKICEGYGCSETSPIISINHQNYPRDIYSVGKILDNVIVEIIEKEICVSGPNIMKGYWNDTQKNDEVFIHKKDEKFYKTGDSGYIQNGYLYYTGRINENYKMSNGKFVNISQLESKLKEYINTNFIVYGENMDHNILIVEEPFNTNMLSKINDNIDNFMKIKKIILIKSEEMKTFLTPKLSIKRKSLINYVKKEYLN